MKAFLEKIDPLTGSSFAIKKFEITHAKNPPVWHFHPEYELVYISNGSGKRHIGKHISHYQYGDLILLGPNLPHLSFSDDLSESHTEIVIQMREDFLGPDLLKRPEFRSIKQLFVRAQKGITFHKKVKRRMGRRLEKLLDLPPFQRLIELLKILQDLANTEDYNLLDGDGFSVIVNPKDLNRMNTIYQYVEKNFHEAIPLDDMAREVNMTVPAFSRYFKKITNKTFTQFVNEYRIDYACRLLEEKDMTISEVCFDSGFQNFSHFNKQFKLVTGKTPTEYRKNLEKVISQTSPSEPEFQEVDWKSKRPIWD